MAAAALATASVRAGERFDCLGRGTRLAGFWIRDHVEPGRYTLDEVVAFSANTGIIEIAERIPQEDLYRTFSAFGFGRRSEIDYPAEARGLMPTVNDWSKLSRAGFALGQELTVTPLQMALATVTSGLIGAVTFFGSLVAFTKLADFKWAKDVRFRGQQVLLPGVAQPAGREAPDPAPS